MIKNLDRISILAAIMIFLVEVQSDKKNSTRSYATCIACMSDVLQMEEELMQNLQRYREKISDKLTLIRFVVDNLRRNHKAAGQDPEMYLSNPLNAFQLVRRMNSDWIKWQEFMKKPMGKTQIAVMNALQNKMPKSNDLTEAQAGIIRIQTTFQLNANDIANGSFKGKYYGAQFSARDCYSIGLYLFNQTRYMSSLSWFNVSLEVYNEQDAALSGVFEVERGDIWLLISISYQHLGKLLLNKEMYKKASEILKLVRKLKHNDWNIWRTDEDLRVLLEYEEVCRGKKLLKRNLHCRYNSTTTPFLKLAPLKMEEIATDPYIVLYHDVIYETEMEVIKRLALPQLSRGLVGFGTVSNIRTVQRAQLHRKNTTVIDRINQRTLDISGLDFLNDLGWEVINYGLAGHYLSHIDYYNYSLTTDTGRGNRLAAIIYYMSDVEAGGGTAFPEIKTVNQPKKGSAIFWYHLDNTGEGNFNSLHASCPILVGSKWMLIKLAYYDYQMLHFPCYKM